MSISWEMWGEIRRQYIEGPGIQKNTVQLEPTWMTERNEDGSPITTVGDDEWQEKMAAQERMSGMVGSENAALRKEGFPRNSFNYHSKELEKSILGCDRPKLRVT